MNNSNSTNLKEKDLKEITVILGKVAGNGYTYLEDTLHERSKIKIPLNYDQCSDYRISIDENSQIKEKSLSGSQKYSNSESSSNIPKLFPEDGKYSHNLGTNNFEDNTEIPLLKRINEINSKENFLIPGCSQWFKNDDIHEIEVKGNPEFFCGKYPSKTPEIYKEYRNYIVNLFRENPNSYLSSTGKIKHSL